MGDRTEMKEKMALVEDAMGGCPHKSWAPHSIAFCDEVGWQCGRGRPDLLQVRPSQTAVPQVRVRSLDAKLRAKRCQASKRGGWSRLGGTAPAAQKVAAWHLVLAVVRQSRGTPAEIHRLATCKKSVTKAIKMTTSRMAAPTLAQYSLLSRSPSL